MWEKYKKYEPIFGAWYINGLIGEGAYGIIREDDAHIPGFIRISGDHRRARFYDRVELLRGLAEYLHCEGVALGLVVYPGERVDHLVKDLLRITKLAVAVVDAYAE